MLQRKVTGLMKVSLYGAAMWTVLTPALAIADPQALTTAPAVSALSSYEYFGSLSVGNHFGATSRGGENAFAVGLNFKARASFIAPVAGSLALQGDGQFEHSTYEVGSQPVFMHQVSSIAGHFFTANSSGLLGVIVQADSSSDSAPYSAGQNNRYFVGLEGQYFHGDTILYGQAAYQRHSLDYIAGAGISDGVSVAGQVSRFVNSNFVVVAKVAYENLCGSNLLEGIDHFSWRVGALAEYRFDASPVSVFGLVHFRKSQLSGSIASGFKEAETRALVGVKLNFASQRRRSGSALDPMQPLRLITPPALYFVRRS
jgi:hypothetical protein